MTLSERHSQCQSRLPGETRPLRSLIFSISYTNESMQMSSGKGLSLDAYRKVNRIAECISGRISSLEEACASISNIKIVCDKETASLKEIENRRPGVVFPDSFLKGVLIRDIPESTLPDDFITPFDANYVVGANRKRYGYEVGFDTNSFVDNCQRMKDYAGSHYTQVGKLPLYYAGEGKNRVEVFRATGATITGKYKLIPFHDRANCRYIHVNRDFSIAIYNRNSKVLLFPSLTEKLLSYYGAKQVFPFSKTLLSFNHRSDFVSNVLRIFPLES